MWGRIHERLEITLTKQQIRAQFNFCPPVNGKKRDRIPKKIRITLKRQIQAQFNCCPPMNGKKWDRMPEKIRITLNEHRLRVFKLNGTKWDRIPEKIKITLNKHQLPAFEQTLTVLKLDWIQRIQAIKQNLTELMSYRIREKVIATLQP